MTSNAVFPPADHPGTICFLIHTFAGGGAQRDAILLANGTAAKGWKVTIVTLNEDGPLRSLIDPSINVATLPTRHLRWSAVSLRRFLRSLRPDVLVSTEVVPNLLSSLVARSLPATIRPVVILREAGSPSVASRLAPFLQVRQAYRFIRYGYPLADSVLTLTDGARNDLIENFRIPAKKVEVMRSNAVLEDGKLATLNIDGPRTAGLIVSVGRLSPEKDQETLVKAFSILASRRDVRLVLAGDGPSRAALEALAEKLGIANRIDFLGNVPDPFPLLCSADVAVCSSRYEGFGNAIVEALACGTSVVATDCQFGPREILRDGDFGKLVDVGDVEALARAIGKVLDSGRNRAELQSRASGHTLSRAAGELLRVVDAIRGQPGTSERTMARRRKIS